MEYKFTVHPVLLEVKSSMELDSGTLLASLEAGNVIVELEVRGDVRVEYQDDIYKAACQFPEELLKAFHDGSAFNDPDVRIIDNNWFELGVYEKKGGKRVWTDYSTVDEEEDYDSVADVFSGMLAFLNEYLEVSASENKEPEVLTLDWYGARIPYRKIAMPDSEDNAEVKVTSDSVFNSLIECGSVLDDQFHCYIPDDLFNHGSDEEVVKFIQRTP